MVQKSMEVQLDNGLEARPVAVFVQVASQYGSTIYVEVDDKKVNAKSIMGMMSLGLDNGETLTVVADGSDATGEYGHISTAGFLVANGNVRGIVMIILLAAAATMFILSALICIKKSKDLNGYLESINAKH